MMIREKIAKLLAPGMRSDAEIRALFSEEIKKIKMALPIVANYDPKNEGYRPLMGMGQNPQLRVISAIDRSRMYDVAYFMWDNSAMFRRLARLDKTFIFSEPFSILSDNENVDRVLKKFAKRNRLQLRFPDKMMWLGILGEQCWPVEVNKFNGDVRIKYADPSLISNVWVLQNDVETIGQVELMGNGGRPGPKYEAVREDLDGRSKFYGRLVGECFFFAINNPPNDPRGRSDYLTLFDWIDSLERYEFNYLERAEFLMNFVWDVLLKGMSEDQIREWLQNNPTPEPGSMRAHNETVEWNAVAPDIKAHDFSAGFETAKGFIMGAAGRPDSWFGAGGKAYQTEAEQFGQVPIKDLDERQLCCKAILEQLCQFQVDQSVIHEVLSEADADEGFDVQMPEISKKDFSKIINGVPQLATALSVAEMNRWATKETVMKIFGTAISQLGYEIDVDAEMEKIGEVDEDDNVTEDYARIDSIVNRVIEKMKLET